MIGLYFPIWEICLSKNVVKAALFIFTGPQIEVWFNLINDIIDKRSS